MSTKTAPESVLAALKQLIVSGTSLNEQEAQTIALGNILTAVSSRFSFAETIWKDSAVTPIYWVMRTSQHPTTFAITTTFTKADGTVGTPTGAITPAASENTTTSTIEYDVIGNGTGYSINDTLSNSVMRAVVGGAVLANFWYNHTLGAVVALNDIDSAKLQRANENITVFGVGEVQASPTPYTVLARLKDLLTELQLKADLTETQPVGATARICVSHQSITIPITTGVTLTSLCSDGVIPVGAVTAEIQALDAVVRYRLDASTVTPTSGMRLNVDDKLVIDSALASVRVVAQSSVAACSVAFFDKV